MLKVRLSHGVWRVALLVAILLSLTLPLSFARKKVSTKITIEPGAKVISAEERAIVADSAMGIDHAVILLEQTERDDTLPGGYRIKYHLRAKILSSEARDLGDITVPVFKEDGRVRKFWAYVIKPDGTVKEIDKKGLKPQVIAKTRRGKTTALKVALPDIEPGCVIDYGYDVSIESFYAPRPVALQRGWPVRHIQYRWLPYQGPSAAYFVTKNAPVEVKQGKDTILVSARDLPPIPDEPYMPPVREVGVYFFPYYYDSAAFGAAYWNEAAKETEKQIKRFCGSKRNMEKIIAKMGLPASADQAEKLRYAYDWMMGNVQNQALMTKDERAKQAIEVEDSRKKRDEVVDSALDVVEKGWANPYQLTLLYTGLARALGANAYFIKAVDRTEQYFKPEITTQRQFDSYFVEVTLPAKPDRAYFLDPGNGMPFGQVAWWLSGVSAFKSTSKGGMIRGVPVAGAWQNPIKTRTEIAFIDDNEALEVSFSQVASGQAMLLTRRNLRYMTAKDREKELLEYCGNSADFEVSVAETGDLIPLNGNYELKCQGEAMSTGLDEDVSTYHFQWGGLWVTGLPDLDAGERKTPVVFNYPVLREDEIHVGIPEGFETTSPPAPVSYDNSFGAYTLAIEQTEGGYIVKRRFERKALLVKPESYSRFVMFLEELERADKTPLVFKKAGGA